MNRLHIW